jgi:IS5 family transposase
MPPSSKTPATGAPKRPTGDRRDAEALRYELESLRSRRVVRLGLMLAEFLRRPWQVWRLPRLLLEALRPVPAPSLPSAAKARRSARTGLQLRAPSRRPRYPHLRVAHLGDPGPFTDLAPHVALDRRGWREQLDEGADLLLLTSSAEGWPLDEITAASRELDVPTVLLASRREDLTALATLGAAEAPDLVVTDDEELATDAAGHVDEERLLRLEPATDLRRCNPVGWQREPEGAAMLVVAQAPGAEGLAAVTDLVGGLDREVTLYATGDVDAAPLASRLAVRGIETLDPPAALADTARRHRVALTHPALHPTPAAHARHVLDLLACGTPVVHPPDDLLERLVPDDLRRPVAGPAEAAEAVTGLLDPDVRERVSVAARRHVLTRHTTRQRFDEILSRLDIPTAAIPTISILLSTTRPEFLDHAHAQIARQDYPALEIITICHGDGFDPEHLERLEAGHSHPTRTLHAPAHWPLGDALNLGLDHATGQLVTKMDDDDSYGPSHLTDLHLALTYSRADVVGKLANFVYLSARDVTIDRYLQHEESFVWHLPGATMLTHREVLAAYRFSRVRRAVDTALYTRLHADGARRYSTHRFDFVRYRGDQHTYARTDEEFLEQAEHTYPGVARDRTEI